MLKLICFMTFLLQECWHMLVENQYYNYKKSTLRTLMYDFAVELFVENTITILPELLSQSK